MLKYVTFMKAWKQASECNRIRAELFLFTWETESEEPYSASENSESELPNAAQNPVAPSSRTPSRLNTPSTSFTSSSLTSVAVSTTTFFDLLRFVFCRRDFWPVAGRSVGVCGFCAVAGRLASSSGNIFRQSGTTHGPLDKP